MPATEQSRLETMYEAFNRRDIEAVLAAMHPDVDWPNGWEGGRLQGRDAVRDYWIRQWAVLDPIVEPVGFHAGEQGSLIVDVHSVVHDKEGKLLADSTIQHVYRFGDGLVRSMEIVKD
ncbi:nuclear transport factor 2 family protein [Paludibaculum fermentans]|uniref:Nuclear transport factor 2 family protein n=1 Tax=Paludibaculum fermentans TaxID=1473598 RepID=A0A7S7SLT7_PALFE|nr:nuclear transport factor 2 family protein [Paludibaculum fermentans]QOY88390.1 nuclear transport factor 2 family protein [Paludibaculum fermentans]